MSRLMSVAMTTDAVIERRKDVTRRLGWWTNFRGARLLNPGDTVTLCEKVQGRQGKPLVRLAEVEAVDVRREPLNLLLADPEYGRREVEREGFPGMDPMEFVDRFFIRAQRLNSDAVVTRIEWRYLNHVAPTPGRVWTDNVRHPGGGTTIYTKRCCNGCGRRLGDTLVSELDAAVCGLPLPNVRDECGCARKAVPA